MQCITTVVVLIYPVNNENTLSYFAVSDTIYIKVILFFFLKIMQIKVIPNGIFYQWVVLSLDIKWYYRHLVAII